MKIRTKLLFLIFSMLLAMILSLAVYIGFEKVLGIAGNEKSELLLLKDLVQQEHIVVCRFFIDDIAIIDQVELFKEAIDNKNTTLERVKNIYLLPKMNDKIKSALIQINLMDEIQVSDQEKFLTAINNFLHVLKEDFGYNNTFSLVDFNSDFAMNRDSYDNIRKHYKNTKYSILPLENDLKESEAIITKQYAIIDEEIRKYKFWGNIVTSGFVFITLVISLIIAFILAGKIARSIRSIGSSLSIIASGDLTKKIYVKSNDEIGVLGSDMNTFQKGLNASLNRIKDSSRKNSDVKDELVSMATETSSAAVEISANISAVHNQMSTLDNNISQSGEEVKEISQFTNELSDHVVEQMAMVEESTASITEMIASITSVSNLTDKNQEVINSLVETAQKGDNKLTETTNIIEDINSSVSEINSMAGVIQSISAQTNLLAMNAAIEAAHAGDQGKGFAVVADEIRKLAEASAKNTKEITKNLKGIIGRIERASSSGISTREAFTDINNNIKGVSEALFAVASSTSELNMGGKQILDAMFSLSEISNTVQTKSDVMKNRAESINGIMGEISNISSSVTAAMSEVNVGFCEVTNSMAGLKDTSDRVNIVSNELDREANQFVTEKDESI